ncbi:hypothetical protein BKA80DRAFT_138834 [Phyllosticta citrichinensis]
MIATPRSPVFFLGFNIVSSLVLSIYPLWEAERSLDTHTQWATRNNQKIFFCVFLLLPSHFFLPIFPSLHPTQARRSADDSKNGLLLLLLLIRVLESSLHAYAHILSLLSTSCMNGGEAAFGAGEMHRLALPRHVRIGVVVGYDRHCRIPLGGFRLWRSILLFCLSTWFTALLVFWSADPVGQCCLVGSELVGRSVVGGVPAVFPSRLANESPCFPRLHCRGRWFGRLWLLVALSIDVVRRLPVVHDTTSTSARLLVWTNRCVLPLLLLLLRLS